MEKLKRERIAAKSPLNRLADWLKMPESFHFDTDLPLDECVTRLNSLARKPRIDDTDETYRTIELTPESIGQYHFRIVLHLPHRFIGHIRLDGTLREKDGITFVDGYTGGGELLVAVMVMIAAVSLATAFLWHIYPALIMLVFAWLLLLTLRMSYLDDRTRLIHRIYDTLDHEQAQPPDILLEDYSTIMKQKHSGQ
jgi:hypothetical protein